MKRKIPEVVPHTKRHRVNADPNSVAEVITDPCAALILGVGPVAYAKASREPGFPEEVAIPGLPVTRVKRRRRADLMRYIAALPKAVRPKAPPAPVKAKTRQRERQAA